MILGTGIDLVTIDRVDAFHRRWGERGLRRLFTAGERAYCLALSRPAQSLAARFAAKEAFFKALGSGWGIGGAWTEVEVVRGPAGRPSLRLSGRAARAARAAGVVRLHLTLTHAREVAGAVVLLEGEDGGASGEP